MPGWPRNPLKAGRRAGAGRDAQQALHGTAGRQIEQPAQRGGGTPAAHSGGGTPHSHPKSPRRRRRRRLKQ